MFCGGENHTIASCTLKNRKLCPASAPKNEIKQNFSFPSCLIFDQGPNKSFLSGIFISALLDSEAQANFLCYDLALKLWFKLTSCPPGRLANGNLFELWDVGKVCFSQMESSMKKVL